MMIVMIAIVIVILRGGNDEEFTANQIQIAANHLRQEIDKEHKVCSSKPYFHQLIIAADQNIRIYNPDNNHAEQIHTNI